MKLYSCNKDYKLYHGNMLDMLEVIEKESIDSVITDPPYELNFMSKTWDRSGIAFKKETWQKCYEVLKPGGYLLAFGGSRTYHRIACAIEDAGFEIRDTIMWLYGSGFPKSLNISKTLEKREGIIEETTGTLFNNPGGKRDLSKRSDYGYIYEPQLYLAKQWKGWGTALKPSFEPIIVARKPFKGSLVDNVIEYGVGGINIDECRVGNEIIKGGTMPKMNAQSDGINLYNFGKHNAERLERQDNIGRFPANTILTYDETDFDEVCGGFPKDKGYKPHKVYSNIKKYEGYGSITQKNGEIIGYGDSGSVSRYFYCAKASKKDRDEGLDNFDVKGAKELLNREENSDGASWNGKYSSGNAYAGSGAPKKNTHPTVKPCELCQYLIRLVSPNGATILDPFNGSGSTGKAVMYENKERNKNYKYIGIELTEEYLPISKARIEYITDVKEEVKQDTSKKQTNIFDFIEEE